jgi:predicted GIY-YIG superfamily endonuclease
MLLMGQHTDYQNGVVLLERLLGILISKTQHFRLVNHYGEAAAPIMEEEIMDVQNSETDIVYSESDGSMILTREPGDGKNGSWQEVKLCRVYHGDDQLSSEKRHWIEHSDYTAHLGDHKEFQSKAERLIDPWEHLKERLVFISDGAAWIHRWQKENYPNATQILDFYHAVEHLSAFACSAITDEQRRKEWVRQRKEELLESKLNEVLQKIKDCAVEQSTTVKKQKDNLINYYRANVDRMDYKSYRKRGLRIGSGAIEAAHRNVIQKRLKLSGQRWTKKGAQNVLNLKVCYMSGRWDKVVELIRNTAA